MKLRNIWLASLALGALIAFAGVRALTGAALTHAAAARATTAPEAGAKRPASAQAKVKAGLEQMPLYFIENKGQLDDRVAYYLQGDDKTLYFTPQGVTFALHGQSDQPDAEQAEPHATTASPDTTAQTEPERWTLKLDFVGANPHVKVTGQEQAAATFNYFTGGKDRWQAGLKTYRSIIYHDLWPGIDLVYAGTVERMKYEFIVKPGADPAQIKLAYRGASSVKLNPAGQLEVTTPATSFQDEKPYSYQEAEGQRVAVTTAYELESEAEAEAQVYGFRVGKYDADKTLVIDPVVLIYSGFIGGRYGELGYDIAVDSEGFAYVTGLTQSAGSFPVKVGPDLTYNGQTWQHTDAFVAKVAPNGSQLVYCGFIGGLGLDVGHGIAVDNLKRAYVTGYTTSDQASFPVKNGPDLTHNGDQDAFIARVSANGQTLEYCGYIGGNKAEGGNAVAVDQFYRATIAGFTDSASLNFPQGYDLSYNGDPNDAFVARVQALGSGLDYGTYLGGNSNDFALGVALDSQGNTYVTGVKWSDETSFPVKIGPALNHKNPGSESTFVARLNQTGLWLDYCGYIGGTSGFDAGLDIAVSPDGVAFVAGSTGSSEAEGFPVKGGPDLTFNGLTDAYVARVKWDGSALDWCGYIGGSGSDSAKGIALDALSNVYVVGDTYSTEATFPVKNGPDLTHNGKGDAFVAKVTATGTSLVYCGYIGGAGIEEAWGIAADKNATNSAVWIVGNTEKPDGFPVLVGPDLTFNGNGPLPWPRYDAFVTKVSQP